MTYGFSNMELQAVEKPITSFINPPDKIPPTDVQRPLLIRQEHPATPRSQLFRVEAIPTRNRHPYHHESQRHIPAH